MGNTNQADRFKGRYLAMKD